MNEADAAPARWSVTRVLWVAYITLTPVYLGRSGQLQVADAILLLLGGAVLAGASRSGVVTIPGRARPVVATLAALVAWSAVVNVGWVVVGGPTSMLQFTAFYAYGLVLVLVVVVLWTEHGARLLATTVHALALTFLILAVAVVRDGGQRAVGTFNDPNQLGYYTILSLTLLEAARRSGVGPNRMVTLGMWVVGAYLIYRSASVSALAAFGLMVAVTWRGLGSRGRYLMAAAAAAAGVLAVSGVLPVSDSYSFISERVENYVAASSDEGLRSLAQRGYDRLWLYPEHLLVGAGEGWFDRFDRSVLDLELHSTLGTMLFSYGLPGLVLVLTLVHSLRRSTEAESLQLLGPVLVYSLFHHGFRFRLLWVVLAVFACLEFRDRSERLSLDPANAGRRRASAPEPGIVE